MSLRDGHVRAFKKPWTRVCRGLRFRGICLGNRVECYPAIASARPRGCESCRAQLCGDNDRIGQLRPRYSPAIGQRRWPGSSIFKIPALTPCWVQSPFLGACIFEHAPPVRS